MRCRILLSESKLYATDNTFVIEKGMQSLIQYFSIFDREIGQQLLQSNFEFFSKTGTTFAVLSTGGKQRRGQTNLSIASNSHFFEEIIFYKVYYLDQKPYQS